MMGKNMGLPPGFRYYPTDEELISCYLKPKILGQKLSCDIVSDAELYGPNSTPWHLFDVNDDDSWTDNPDRPSEKFLYVFTTLSKVRTLGIKKGATRENNCKKAGCGTWAAKTSPKLIKDCDSNLIGERRQLVFEINETGPRVDLSKAGYFRMHEYSLCGVNKGLKSAPGLGDVVLCKITFDSDKEPILKLGSKSTDHVSKSCRGDENREQNNENFKGGVGVYLDGTSDGVVEMNCGVGVNSEGAECLSLTSENVFTVENGVPDTDNYVMMDSGVGINSKDTECLTSENVFAVDTGFPDFDDSVVADRFFQESDDFVGDHSFDMDWFVGLLTSDQELVEDISKLGKRKYEEENMYVTKKMCL